jgi:ribosome assembly protein YihI (activator of Der GTPase)
MELDEKREEAKKATVESAGTNLLVYNVPPELYSKCISLAKLYYNNQLWKVLEAGVERILTDKDKWKEEINERISALETKLAFLTESSQEEDKKEKATFGSGGE